MSPTIGHKHNQQCPAADEEGQSWIANRRPQALGYGIVHASLGLVVRFRTALVAIPSNHGLLLVIDLV